MSATNREPAGTPTGGQFAAGHTGEASVDLVTEDAHEAALEKVRALDDQAHHLRAKAAQLEVQADDAVVARVAILTKLLNPDTDRITVERSDDSWVAQDLIDVEGSLLRPVMYDEQACDVRDMLTDTVAELTPNAWMREDVAEHTVDVGPGVRNYDTITLKLG